MKNKQSQGDGIREMNGCGFGSRAISHRFKCSNQKVGRTLHPNVARSLEPNFDVIDRFTINRRDNHIERQRKARKNKNKSTPTKQVKR